MNGNEIHAVIGVWHNGARTFYVRRSLTMQNYPGVWSLLSRQFDPQVFDDKYDFAAVQQLFDQMSAERLNNVGISIRRFLSSSFCINNPMRKRVFLHMYDVELQQEPVLNSEFYTDFAWMMPEQYTRAAEGSSCGLCVRMWSDHCVHAGLAATQFAAAVQMQH